MENPLSSLDWSLVQAFLAVAETGSLSAAARRLGSSQPTLGRRVHRIEEALGLSLFHRHARGLELSEAGQALLTPAQEMQEAAGRMALLAAGRDRQLEGVVRISASMVVAHFVLPPILARLRQEAPGIQIDLVPSDQTENLLFREADIAIRMYRPEQLEVITSHVADLPIGLFAARSYLARAGTPASPEELLEHDFIGYDRDERIIRGMAQMGWKVTRKDFALRTDDQAAYWHLVRAGCGIGVAQVLAVRGEEDIVRLFPDLPIPPLPVWLAAHEAMRATPRIRRVWDALAQGLRAAILDPPAKAG